MSRNEVSGRFPHPASGSSWISDTVPVQYCSSLHMRQALIAWPGPDGRNWRNNRSFGLFKIISLLRVAVIGEDNKSAEPWKQRRTNRFGLSRARATSLSRKDPQNSSPSLRISRLIYQQQHRTPKNTRYRRLSTPSGRRWGRRGCGQGDSCGRLGIGSVSALLVSKTADD